MSSYPKFRVTDLWTFRPLNLHQGWGEGGTAPYNMGGPEKIKRKKKRGKKNKVGYTATSCGWVGRGGYARFPTFRLMLMDRRTDGQTDQRMDKASYGVACPQLKKKKVAKALDGQRYPCPA